MIANKLRSGSAAIALSVISSSSRAGSRSTSANAFSTLAGNRRSCKLRAETLIDTRMSKRLDSVSVDGGLGQHELGERADQLGVLGECDEVGGWHLSEGRMPPAHQRFHAVRSTVPKTGEWLVVDLQLVGGYRIRQFAEQTESATLRPRTDRLVALDAGAVPLGAVHGHVGGSQQVIGGSAVRGRERQPDADAHGQWKAVDDDGSCDLSAHLLDHRHGRRVRADLRDQQSEFVTTETSNDGALRCRLPQLFGHAEQHHVTGLVPEPVVDLLEAVEIQQQQSAPHLIGIRRQEAGETVVEGAPVQQLSEIVVARFVRPTQRLLRALVDEQRRDAEQRQHQQAEVNGDDEDRRQRQQRTVGRDADEEAATHHRSHPGLVVKCEHEARQHAVGDEHETTGDNDPDRPSIATGDLRP